MFNIMPINQQFSAVIQQKIDLKTKPLGALGQLESCAKQLTLIFSKQLDNEQALVAFKPVISNPSLVVFAGDHGVASQVCRLLLAALHRKWWQTLQQEAQRSTCFAVSWAGS